MFTSEHLDLAAKPTLTPSEKVRYAELKKELYKNRINEAERHSLIMAGITIGSMACCACMPAMVLPCVVATILTVHAAGTRVDKLPDICEQLAYFDSMNPQMSKIQMPDFSKARKNGDSVSGLEKFVAMQKEMDLQDAWMDDTRTAGTRQAIIGSIEECRADIRIEFILAGIALLIGSFVSGPVFGGIVFGFCALSALSAKLDARYTVQPMFEKWEEREEQARRDLANERTVVHENVKVTQDERTVDLPVVSSQKKRPENDIGRTKD